MRFFQTENPTVRFGSVFKNRKSYSAVRCGFQLLLWILRCGLENLTPYGAFRISDISYGPVRFGSSLNRRFYGAVPIPVGKTVQHTPFTTYIWTVLNGGFVRFSCFYRGTITKTLFLYGAPYEWTVQTRCFVRLLTLFLGAIQTGDASSAASKRATSSKRCCKSCRRRRCYYCLRLQARAPLPPRSYDLRRPDPSSGREDNKEEGGPIFSLWRRCLHSECRGAQVRSHVCLLVLAARTPSVPLVGCCKSAAAAASVYFSNIKIQYLAIFRLSDDAHDGRLSILTIFPTEIRW